MGAKIIQNDFTHGEISRKLFSRVDLDIYIKSAQKIRNAVVIPQGGARRRFGTQYIDTIDAQENQYMLAQFEAPDGFGYLLVLRDATLDIYYNDLLVASLVAPWTLADLEQRNVRFAQTHDRMVFTNGNFQPRVLTRVTHPGVWDFSTIAFRNRSTYDFEDVNYDGFTFTMTATTIGSTATLTSSIAIFTNDYIDGIFTAVGPSTDIEIGRARITAVGSATPITTCTVTILSSFNSVLSGAGVRGSEALLTEPAFSDSRGWPIATTFYEGRLWFGGTRDLPQTLFSSVVNDFFNFDEGTGLDADGITITMGSNNVNSIRYLVGDKNFQIFTTGGEFAIPQTSEQPITPSSVSIRQQSNKGTEAVAPVVFDNQTFFVKRGGKGVIAFQYDWTIGAYRSTDASLLSPQLIVQPVDSDILVGSPTDDADYLFLVNQDGTLAVYQSLQAENVSAWTLSDTDGQFKRVVSVKDDVYFIIERRIDGVLKQYLEKLSFSLFTDSTIVIKTPFNPVQTLSGLGTLEGKTVQLRVKVEGQEGFFVYPDQVVENGDVVIPESLDPVTEAEVGLPYVPMIQPMPVTVPSQEGNIIYLPKRLSRIFVDYFESIGILVDGVLVPNLHFDQPLDAPATPQTGLYEYDFLGGWDRRQAPVFSQNIPAPMTILGVGYEVEM